MDLKEGGALPSMDEQPDIHLIDLLCQEVLTHFCIDTSVLHNWQAELIDLTKDGHLLSAAILETILLPPKTKVYFTQHNKNCMATIFEAINDLEDSVYHEFKLLIYELLIQTTTFSYTAKIQLYRLNLLPVLLNDFLEYSETEEIEDKNADRRITSQKLRLLTSFLELGCGVKQLHALFYPLLAKSPRIKTRTKELLLEVLYSTFTQNQFHFTFFIFNSFVRKKVPFPLLGDLKLLRCFSVSAWFKVNHPVLEKVTDETSITTLILFANASDMNASVLKIQLINYKQLMVEIHNVRNGSRMQFTFNHIVDLPHKENQGYTQFVITYDPYKNLNLFIDGEHSESIPCASLSDTTNSWNKVYIGQLYESDDLIHGVFDRDELLLKDLFILNLALSYEWIAASFFLGIDYNWRHNDYSRDSVANLVNHLSHRTAVALQIRIDDVLRAGSSKFTPSHQIKPFGAPFISNKIGTPADKSAIVNLLWKSVPKKCDIRFDSSEVGLAEQIESSSNQDALVHQSESIHGALYCLGGTGLLLSLIEVLAKGEYETDRARNKVFLKTIDLLLECLSSNWRLNKEFENSDGYEILALLLSYFKDNFNQFLKFETSAEHHLSEQIQSSANAHFEHYEGLLERFLAFSGCKKENKQESIIYNPVAYKSLILNLNFYLGTSEYSKLHEHLRVLIGRGKYSSFNSKQLSAMKLLKKLVHHIKVQILGDKNFLLDNKQLSVTLNAVIRHNISVDNIRAMSRFVIFLLFHGLDNNSREIGVSALKGLTEELCKPSCSIKSLKRFSRSITIHWLLLLLSYENDSTLQAEQVAYYGLMSLVRLLNVLGPHIIKRFFHSNNGLNVLTYFLKHWWSNDRILCVLFQASFGADIPISPIPDVTLVKLAKDEKLVKVSAKLIMPEFMLILNNMALQGMYVLSMKHGKILSVPNSPAKSGHQSRSSTDKIREIAFDTLKLVDQYCVMIEAGNQNSIALQDLFFSKEWLEGSFELLGQLKLSLTWLTENFVQRFEACTKKFISVLSKIFISKLSSVKDLLDMLKSLSDITIKIALDAVFPEVFQRISEFLGNSKFIYNEENFLKGALEMIFYYHREFMEPKFFVNSADLEIYIDCIVLVLEAVDGDGKYIHASGKLGNILGNAMVLKLSFLTFSNLGTQEVSEEEEFEFSQRFDDNVKFILLKQFVLSENGAFHSSHLSQILEILMGSFLKLSTKSQLLVSEHFLNLMRTCYLMRQTKFEETVDQICTLSDYSNASEVVNDFFAGLTSKNDEETIRHLQKFPTIKHIFNKNYHFRVGKLRETGDLKVIDMIAVMLNNGGRLGFLNTSKIKGFEKDCEILRALAISRELKNYSSDLLDAQANDTISNSLFNSMKIEISRSFFDSFAKNNNYMLDYIEGVDRMRKLLILEAQLADSEKLSYSVSVPLKQISAANAEFADFDNSGFVFTNDQTNLLDNSLASPGAEDYEEVDDLGDSDEQENSAYEDRNRKVLRSLFVGDQIQSLWNVCRINGLDAVESLMIVGSNNVYLIENYFHSSNGNVVDVEEASADERDPYLQLIKPQTKGKNAFKTHRVSSWNLDTLGSISKRKFLLRDIALEMFFDDGASILLTCLTSKQRDSVYHYISPYSKKKGLDKELATTLEISSNLLKTSNLNSLAGFFSAARIAAAFTHNFSQSSLSASKKWRNGEISNFYYLMTLNTMAGRTFNDLTQYPVFPWVIADYESEELDLSDPKTFRDLSRPMGAQTQARAQEFKERFNVLLSLDDDKIRAFHYGTHYSSAMIVASYLIRLKPYVQSYLLLQGGKFDHAERLFSSIERAWNSASRDNTSDIRELTPEFFYLPEFLTNSNNFELGKLQNGISIGDVDLPKWAKGDPKIFIAKNREALESPYVSANLHKWIDLVFGYKQSGAEAIEAVNVFHHLSYEGAVNLDHMKDDVEKRAVIGMINNFGQTPAKLFNKPHLKKEILNLPNYYLSLPELKNFHLSFESKLNLPITKLEISAKSGKWIGRPNCVSSEDDLLIRKPSPLTSKFGCSSLIINTALLLNLHTDNIATLLQIGNKRFVTGSSGGAIHVWKCTLKPNISVWHQHILRGHFSGVKLLQYSKTFNVCISVDEDGCLILWDFTRFKFVRKIVPSTKESPSNLLVSISNDTGNICTISTTMNSNILTVLTLNGDLILERILDSGEVTAVSIASFNGSLIDSNGREICHNYWSSEVIFACYAKPKRCIQLHELTAESGEWKLALLKEMDLQGKKIGPISCIQALKRSKIDHEEKLSRGHFLVVVGDSAGCVYVL